MKRLGVRAWRTGQAVRVGMGARDRAVGDKGGELLAAHSMLRGGAASKRSRRLRRESCHDSYRRTSGHQCPLRPFSARRKREI